MHRQYVKIVVLGDSAVGKTSLIQRFTSGGFSGQYKSTIRVDFLHREVDLEAKKTVIA